MFRPLEIFIGLRYTRAKRRNHFISFISLISMLGIALGVTALITVLSVMNGFEKELRERILGMASHATIAEFGGQLRNWEAVMAQAEGADRVVGVAPYVEGEGMFSSGRQVSGAMVRGVIPDLEARVSRVGEHIIFGSMDDLQARGFGVVLGKELALALGVGMGDRVTLITPQAAVTPVGVLPRMRRLNVVGIFEVGMFEYDRSTAFIHLDDARQIYQTDDAVSGLRLKLDDMMRAPIIARQVAAELDGRFWVNDWTRQHANFFRAVQTEKTVMFIILSLIVAVAAFNIVSTLVMVVIDKQADIAILRTLGLSPRSVMAVFMVQGTVIGVVGTLLGVAGGITLALNVETIVPAIESLLGQQFLSPDVYYISDLPSELNLQDVGRIGSLAFALTVLATLYPAWRASRTQPAEALRYE
ncbi:MULTISPECIES: lipoprotein-releasing ABC transporter permease subunit [Ectothiorhodospira]|uniref:lipoprotein-releasing ABC transporter permease subunit n=1 Tax=Ectothiorhodospira TaxID=1051 RepID=UPI001EE7C843|nr:MULTISPECIES: lipoprotein-releasing ABC transporter permease subunit [Ectothiorhodospira]MCG5493145.1 lipoprotein-releasing ABC transporter permease subunit [Ectothiorhodospira variabilis]MCG5497133.1 lipoprotein-releasing ABC transporter permease subunit [Ectothiorhodospira variabilis]MCG5502474.1 lipoprotein-releasing ABC transporter permease subunit [Ectothiorhodospira variabilis]MCG5505760.1 lipoprotein-releasing ABC transporter permease subunit [Ectothiorhodospira variabilis]MCG5525485